MSFGNCATATYCLSMRRTRGIPNPRRPKGVKSHDNVMTSSSSPDTSGQTNSSADDFPQRPAPAPHRMSPRNRILFFVTAWLIVLMPLLFWWNTWFGRQLTDKQVSEYLNDEKHPRHIQHALVQLGERMMKHDASASRWYPELLRLASHPVEEVRNTDA